MPELLWRIGEPIRYGYVDRRWPLAAYQNVYATTPGSAEMPSAGRPITERLIDALVARGIGVAAICLHTGVSSPERHEPPFPEQYDVPLETVRAVQATRAAGGRVIAVGTTVVRALETAVGDRGVVPPGSGWTRLVIEPDREIQVVDGLITGWHEPEASHLMMLEAIAGPELLERSYAEAVARGYLWHEFGDSHLILAEPGSPRDEPGGWRGLATSTRMCRRWIAVAAVVALAIVGADAAGATAQARLQTSCFWSQEGASKFGIGVNYAFPDSGAVYWAARITMPAGSYVVFRGRFAHARYQSLNAYDATTHAPVDGLDDVDTAPDPGLGQPLPGGRRPGRGQALLHDPDVRHAAPGAPRPQRPVRRSERAGGPGSDLPHLRA